MTHAETPSARPTILNLQASRIREVANAGLGRDDVLAFWFGEPYQTTPLVIREAAQRALDEGDTFYHHNLGLPALRSALSSYLSSLHQPVSPEQIAVTSSGVNALMLCAQSIIEPGDRVVLVTPLWPNLVEIPKILGAQVVTVDIELQVDQWFLDLDQLLDALKPGTKALMLNSPNNPTGWTMPAAQLAILLAHCRRHGIWFISDEAYNRLVFDGSYQAPSLLDICEPNDRVMVANTFSKTWQMTGWRLGWIVAPPAVIEQLAKLIEFNTSCAPGFVQRAGIAAIEAGPSIIHPYVDELAASTHWLWSQLSQLPGITPGRPSGAMYVFFQVAGHSDSVALAKRLVREFGLGLAPGTAFSPRAQSYLRWCTAKPIPILEQGVERFRASLA